jgi:hypothetical protein
MGEWRKQQTRPTWNRVGALVKGNSRAGANPASPTILSILHAVLNLVNNDVKIITASGFLLDWRFVKQPFPFSLWWPLQVVGTVVN